MARTPGSKTTNTPSVLKNIGGDNEDQFLSEVLSGHIRWKAKAAEKQAMGHDSSNEDEYSEAYRVLLHRFSQIEKIEIDEQ